MKTPFSRQVLPSNHVLSQVVAGEAVLLDLNSERYFGLDEIGSQVWRSIDEGTGLEGAVEAIAREFETDEGTLRSDIGRLVEQMADEGLVTLETREGE